MLEVTVVTKEGCSLCDKVVKALSSFSSKVPHRLRLLDMNGDPELQGRYLIRIPVVIVGGREVFEAKDMDMAGLWKSKLENIVTELASR